MIPNIPNSEDYTENFEDEDEELESDFEVEIEPSYTYAMKVPDDEVGESTFIGKIDDVEAKQQAIMKVLNTERYEHEIYSWDYGIETRDLFGMDIDYVMSEIKARITDAVLQDDRFESVDDFEVQQVSKKSIHCTFTVTTADGEKINSEYDYEEGGEEDV